MTEYHPNIPEEDWSESSPKYDSYKKQSVEYWRQHPFYAPDTVVLGLDVGAKGVGVCIRKGTEILYDKFIVVDLPEDDPWALRRMYRLERHARKNRRVRMRRLRNLFIEHNLPWVDDDVMRRSDPFVLRYRAVKGKLASKEALSICIRSLVRRRGFDYYAFSDEGAYPWGDSTALADVKRWMSCVFVDDDVGKYILGLQDELTFRGMPLDDDAREQLFNFIQERKEESAKRDINKICEEYAKKKQHKDFERRARGMRFSRSQVEKSLREILERHADLIENYDDFVATLFHPCKDKEGKEKAIFYYNRKTPEEAKRHAEKKVKDCLLSEWLEIPVDARKCCLKKDPWFRRWKLVDFLSTSRFYLSKKVGKKEESPELRLLPESVVRDIIQTSVPEALEPGKRVKWTEVKSAMTASLTLEGWVLSSRIAREHKDWNGEQELTLKDLCIPEVIHLWERANLSSYACEKLFNIATDNGRSFDPELMEARKKESGLYECRQEVTIHKEPFPQVMALLGIVGKSSRDQGIELEQKTWGLLNRLFNKELASQLGGKTVPDYVVIKCIRKAPRTRWEWDNMEKEERRERFADDRLLDSYGIPCGMGFHISHSEYLRVILWEQQGGTKTTPARCPFTGQLLPTLDPLDSQLELAHIYPDSKGGHYTKDNLVLTTRQVNAIMGNYTPVEAARRGLFGQSAEQMVEASMFFRWNKRKRELFAWGMNGEEGFPECFYDLRSVSSFTSQLCNYVAFWLGIFKDPTAQRERIGISSGMDSVAMRRSLFPETEFYSSRQEYTRYREDAALLSCIPPTGMNVIQYKGIFLNKSVEWMDPKDQTIKQIRRRHALTIEDGMPYPDIARFLDENTSVPVVKRRSTSKYKSLGNSTFWRVDKEGHTWQRTPLSPDRTRTSSEILDALRASRIPENRIPCVSVIEEWLSQCSELMWGDSDGAIPFLRLKNTKGEEKKGAPVKSVWKKDSRGSLTNSPLGWSGAINEKGNLYQLRSLVASNDRLELWLGWNPKKARWEYQKRVCPTVNAWRGLQRMGLLTKQLERLPEFVRRVIEKDRARSLKEVILGKLYPHSVLVATIRKGDVLRTLFEYDPKLCEEEKKGLSEVMWGEVASLKSSGQIEIKSLERKEMKPCTLSSVSAIASVFGLQSAEEEAQARGLKP
jgi:hypothetical protein